MSTRVAIVGAGIAGLALATLLRRAGIDCEVYEQTHRFTAVGAGIQLSPNGVRVLFRLGLADALAESGVVARSIETRRWDDGALLSRVSHGEDCAAAYGAPYYLIHRADLQRSLVRLLPAGEAQLGRRAAAVTERPGHVELRLEDGTRETADLVVGADGVHSVVRTAIVADEPIFSGYSVYRGLLPAGLLPGLVRDPRVMFWFGPQRHVTYYPIAGRRIIHFSAVAETPGAAVGRSATDGVAEELASKFDGWHPDVRRVVTATRSVTRWGLFDRDVIPRYGTGRLVLIGDAAHPTLPYLSQGANQALEDAETLAGLLVEDPGTAIRRYQAIRHPRTAEVHRQARLRARAFHLSDGPEQRARDAVLAAEQTLEHLDWLYAVPAAA